MNLNNVKKYANSELESYQLNESLTQVKNQIKDAESGREVVMDDYFKTLREPLIEQQKKKIKTG